MRIEFVASGNKVLAKVNSKLSLERSVFIFEMDCGSPAFALLMAEHLNKRHLEAMQEIRQVSYLRGHMHGRRHEAREGTSIPEFACLDEAYKWERDEVRA